MELQPEQFEGYVCSTCSLPSWTTLSKRTMGSDSHEWYLFCCITYSVWVADEWPNQRQVGAMHMRRLDFTLLLYSHLSCDICGCLKCYCKSSNLPINLYALYQSSCSLEIVLRRFTGATPKVRSEFGGVLVMRVEAPAWFLCLLQTIV